MDESEEQFPEPLKLTYAAPSSEVRWVMLGKFQSFEANLLQAKLQSENIPCQLGNENSASFNVPVMVEVDLQVPSVDLERAREVLQSIRQRRAAHDEIIARHCPKCYSANVQTLPFSPVFIVVSLFFLGLPLLLSNHYKQCNECGHRWRVW